ncbi:MAG: HlyC/CorC family transporter [Bacteroidales bacterium]|nr:HlyC/CorC family transporter [Bacteroidales bacterium]
MALLVLYFSFTLFISFVCSLMESVLLSTTPIFVKLNENSSKKGVRKLVKFKNNVDKSLSAILSLNTIANTAGAAMVGAQASEVLGSESLGVVSALLTVLILIFSEIMPKTLGTNNWEKLAGLVGHLISVIYVLTYPLVVMAQQLTRLFKKKDSGHTTSREEISALANIGAEEGIFKANENAIIQNLMKLKNYRVSDVMTPRVVVCSADEQMTLGEFLAGKNYLRFSRIPVYAQKDENITGYVFRQQVMESLAEDHNTLKLKDLRRNILIVPNTKPVFSLWEDMLRKKEQIALVVDEYGGMDGIVTLEDIIETLLGIEILDEKDTVADMQQYARERWKIRQNKYKYLES